MNNRIDYIDFAKGGCFLLVIIGHTIQYGRINSLIRGLIFSFHMPLFFILSCVTYKYSESIDSFFKKTKKAAKHLLTPIVIIYIFTLLILPLIM